MPYHTHGQISLLGEGDAHITYYSIVGAVKRVKRVRFGVVEKVEKFEDFVPLLSEVHRRHNYQMPSKSVREQLAVGTGLTFKQISRWFTNAKQRRQ